MGLSGGDYPPPNLTTMNTHTQPNLTERHATINLGLDAHAKWFRVGRRLDGATPQPV
jgi:hypothetical protein